MKSFVRPGLPKRFAGDQFANATTQFERSLKFAMKPLFNYAALTIGKGSGLGGTAALSLRRIRTQFDDSTRSWANQSV